jgi:class 3 adenylate cyclase/CHASE2 domain-containing sensor protein
VDHLFFLQQHPRQITALFSAAVALAASLALGRTTGWVDGFFYDLSLTVQGARPGTGGEPVAVIAIDRSSLDSDELAATPRVFFGPFWAKLIDGLFDSGAKAIGFDVIFSYSANRFPALNAQYDWSFYDALARHHDRMVLARSAGLPVAPPIEASVYDLDRDAGKDEPGAIGYVELIPDSDGVQRWTTANLHTAEHRWLPTLSAALIARAQAPKMPEQLLLAPAAPLEAIPTYGLADVLRCLKRDPAALRKAFAAKVVLIGTNLPEEDRVRAPDRFMRPARATPAGSNECSLGWLGASAPQSGTVPRVFIHAAAVHSLLSGNIVDLLPPLGRAAAALLTSAGGLLLGFTSSPLIAVVGVVALAIACFAVACALLPFGLWFPIGIPITAAVAAMVLAYLVRVLVEERRRRRVQEAFCHYLAPSLVDQLVDGEAELRLGGERREVTIMFADLSGFTALSTRLLPEELMALTNSYHALMVEAVEANGGYVNQFVGDAVMAIFGAPVPNPDHAASAARAALRVVESVMQAKTDADRLGEPGYAVKIGLNTGPAVVGNVGAPKRYNYTAVGETVNIAARLESVPEDYGCRIVIGPNTAAAIADRFVVSELDWIKVKGKDASFSVYQLIGEKSTTNEAELASLAQYEAGLERYRAGDFAAAEELWRCQSKYPNPWFTATSPPFVMARRCAGLRAAPPESWDGIYTKTTK